MIHKLVSLVQLRTKLERLDDPSIVQFVTFMLSTWEKGSETVISGIFGQLYTQGESNNAALLLSFNGKAQELIASLNKK